MPQRFILRLFSALLLFGGFLVLPFLPLSAVSSTADHPQVSSFDSIFVVTPYFSPNGDGNLDNARLEFAIDDTSTVFVYVSTPLIDDTLTVIFDDTLTNFRITNFVLWDGRVAGVLLGDGAYDIVFDSREDNGTQHHNQRQVVIDTQFPQVSLVDVSPRLFNPTVPGATQDIRVRVAITHSQLTDTLGVEMRERGTDSLLASFALIDAFSGDGEYTAVCTQCDVVGADGVHDILAFASDLAANTTTATDSVDKNILPPDLSFIHPTSRSSVSLTTADSLTGVLFDRHALSNVRFELITTDTVQVTPVLLPARNDSTRFFMDISTLLANEGDYTFKIVVADSSGLADSLQLELKVDRTSPPVPQFIPTLNPVSQSQFIPIRLLLGEDTSSVIRSGGTLVVADTLSVSGDTLFIAQFELVRGRNVIQFKAMDQARNISDAVIAIVNWETSIDITAPERFRAGNQIQVGVGNLTALGVSISVYAMDGSSVQRFDDPTAKSVYSFSWDLRTPNGIEVRNGAYLLVARIRQSGAGERILRKMIAVVE